MADAHGHQIYSHDEVFCPAELTGLALAEHIETDARQRLAAGRSVDLTRYLTTVAHLDNEPTALDAAIDMALRGLVQSGMTREQAAAHLCERYEQFQPAIMDAVELDNALWSTQSVSGLLGQSQVTRSLPADFGPPLSDGRGRYELNEMLGAGSYGQVYRANDRQLADVDQDAVVSIKILPGSAASGQWNRWLADEATKARRVRHENVVSVLDRGTSADGEVFIVYEYVDGGDLREYAKARSDRIEPRQAARIIADIATGVHAAHMAGLVHCDLKPSNVVMTADGQPKIADFGVARRYGSADDPDTQSSERIGNPAFMSPEQYRMEHSSLTIPTDIYALGGMLFWLITGQYPNGDTPAEIARRHTADDDGLQSPSMRPVCAEVDDDLDRIAQRAMALDPLARHDSARALASDLQRWLRREPIDWLHVSPLRRLELWCRRRPGLAATIMIASVLVLVSITMAVIFAQQAAISNAELAGEERARNNFLATLSEFEATFDEAEESGRLDEMFRDIWYSRWLYEPTEWASPDDLAAEMDRTRISAVEQQVQRLRAETGPDTVRVLMWEGCLAFWYVTDERYAPALDVIDTAAANANAVLKPHDPWHLHLQGLRAIAMFNLPEHPDRPALEQIELRLSETEADLERTARWSSMHTLMIRTLREVYGTEHLNMQDRKAAMQDKLDAIALADQF